VLGEFTDEKARERYFAAYETVLRKWPVPAEELDVDTRFGTTRVRRGGTGPGTPVVLLSGIFGTSLSWYPHIASLAARHPVYAVDTIGEPGRSTQTHPVQTPDACADWLADVLAGLGHEEVHLAGVSRGGWFALNLAARSSNGLAGVTAFEPAGFSVLGKRFMLWGLAELLRSLAPQAVLRLTTPGDPAVRRTLRPLLSRGLKYRMHLPPQHVFTDDELRSIAVPTRVVLGERSVVHRSREVLARLGAVNPRIRVEIVPGTTHSLSLEEPGLVTARILDAARDHHTAIGEPGGDAGL